ncbi:MAG: carboxy-S-adenosyl-L-methionine synthase CmoA [bacterium]
MNIDRLFFSVDPDVSSFAFDAKVASVFDDMLCRSIPCYEELQQILVQFILTYARSSGVVYDLGCSTGTTFLACFQQQVSPLLRFIGIDSSEDMLTIAKKKLKPYLSQVAFMPHDLNHYVDFKPASVVVLNLTLQFLGYDCRQRLLQHIYRSLVPGGALLLVEKVSIIPEVLQRNFTDFHYAYKEKKGYSIREINRKEVALKDVLLPLSVSENETLLSKAGFVSYHSFFQYLNFWGVVAVKELDDEKK